jgi:glutathionylspermidine synthase
MFRVELPQRASDAPHTETAAYKSQAGYWWEGIGYEITYKQAGQLRKDAAEMLARYADAMDYVIANPKILQQFYFMDDKKANATLHELAKESWQDPSQRSYAMDRWDIGWDGINPPKVLERNFGHIGLIVGTGVVQTEYINWLKQQNGYADVENFANLRNQFMIAFREVTSDRRLNQQSKITLISQPNTPGADQGMIQAGATLFDWLNICGCSQLTAWQAHSISNTPKGVYLYRPIMDIETMALQQVMTKFACEYSSDNHALLQYANMEFGGGRIEMKLPQDTTIYPFVCFDGYAQDLAIRISQSQSVERTNITLQPFWTLLAGHKSMLPVLHELFPDHPNFLPTVRGTKGIPGQKGFMKHVNGCQGFGAKVKAANGEITHKRKDNSREWTSYRSPKNYITQAYCDAIPNPDGSFKVMHMFTTNGYPAGIGMREGPEPFVGGDNTKTRFLPIIVRAEPSVGQSFYSYHPLDPAKGLAGGYEVIRTASGGLKLEL